MSVNITRPIIGIENRTAQEVFDIMVARIEATPAPHSKLVAEVLTVDMDAPLTAVDRLRALAGGSRDIAFEPSDADEILEKLEALAAILSAPNLRSAIHQRPQSKGSQP